MAEQIVVLRRRLDVQNTAFDILKMNELKDRYREIATKKAL